MRLLLPLLLVYVGSSAEAHAQSTASTPSELDAATVYHNGAQLTRTGTVELEAGTQTVDFTGLEHALYVETIHLEFAESVDVFSLKYEKDEAFTRAKPDSIVALEASLDSARLAIRYLEAEQAGYTEALSVVQSNHRITVSEDEGYIATLAEAVRATQRSTTELRRQLLTIDLRMENLVERRDNVRQRISTWRSKKRSLAGRIRAELIAARAGNFTYTVEYLVPDAGWAAAYDVYVDTEEPAPHCELALMASVVQHTGVDWESIDLTLSTGNPQVSIAAPRLRRATLTDQPRVYGVTNASVHGLVRLDGIVATTRASKSVHAGAVYGDSGDDISIRGGRDDAPQYIIDGIRVTGGAEALVPEAEINAIRPAISGTPASNRLDEVIVTGYGTYSPSRARAARRISFGEQAASQASRIYHIAKPFSAPSSEKPQSIRLRVDPLDLRLRHHAVPKAQARVYLEGLLTGWDTLGLIARPTRIHLDGRYLGQSRLDIPADTNVITLPLGIDELVTLTRTPTEHVREDAVLSRKRTYQQGYTIEFFNQRRTQVELLVEDQIPFSAGAAAKVTLLETVPPADHDAATGTLTWELSLKPAERRQLRVDYEVEAGRGVHVVRE